MPLSQRVGRGQLSSFFTAPPPPDPHPTSHHGTLQRGTKRRESGWVDLGCAPTLRRENCVLMSFCHKHLMELKHQGNTYVQAVIFNAVAPLKKKNMQISAYRLSAYLHFPSPLHYTGITSNAKQSTTFSSAEGLPFCSWSQENNPPISHSEEFL